MGEKYQTVGSQRSTKKRTILVAFLAVIILVGIIIAVYLAVRSSGTDKGKHGRRLPPSERAEMYKTAAVSADAPQCSIVGKDLLLKGGNAVDATIGALFCAGVVNIHSTGLGGGGFTVIYDSKTKKSYAYDYRETAPKLASRDMFLKNGTSSVIGGLAIGVPGEVKGLYDMWRKHGSLKWAEIVKPSQKLAANGFPFSKPVHEASLLSLSKIKADPGLKELLMKNGKLFEPGEMFKNPKLAKTLEIIMKDPLSFYNGSLAKRVLKDVQNAKGILTRDDLRDYKTATRDILKSTIPGDLSVYVMGPPSGGAVVSMILNILKGYGFTSDDMETTSKKVAAYHKIIEAYKFSYSRRALLGDPTYLNKTYVRKVVDEMMSESVAKMIRLNKIWINQTHPNVSYYGGYYGKEDYGTSHVSALDKDGMAVSSTSTINYYFGCGVRSLDTGIIYNNEMDDFSSPGKPNIYGYPPTPANYIVPGKRPLSSMAPAILTDKNGKVKVVVGAAGGSMIITGVARTIINKLFFQMGLGPAISSPRFHHQLIPNVVMTEKKYPLQEDVVKGLKRLGHKFIERTSKAVVQGIFVDGSKIFAKSDPRKESKSAGY